MFPASQQAYDRAITVFSPDGRLFQVEYAREAVKRGSTALGIIYKNGVLLGIDKNVTSKLLKGESIEKIFKLDEHIAAATSGLVADARRLIDFARETCQEERFIYNEPIEVDTLTKKICDLKQMYTQWGGARPFGTALLIIGIDDSGKHLFETDPSGAMQELYACSIGAGKKEVETIFEKEYVGELKFDDAVDLALRALSQVGDKKIAKDTVDLSYIDEKSREYVEMPKDVLDGHIKKVSPAKKEEKKE